MKIEEMLLKSLEDDMIKNDLDLNFIREKSHYHFIGVGGSGMSGIAEVMVNSGYHVSGSDIVYSKTMERLQSLGVEIFVGHNANQIENANYVVVSSAIDETNPELISARSQNIPILQRAEMLAKLMNEKDGITIAGTHGKTTTTCMLSYVLADNQLDPTYIIGGILNNSRTNAKLGNSNWLIAEADESDASFLLLKSRISVITNIDQDHTWFYNDDFNKIRASFLDFIHNLPEDGLAVLCIDDDEVRALTKSVKRPYITYGFSEQAQVKALNFKQNELRTHFLVQFPGEEPHTMELKIPGEHNVLNALAVIIIARRLGLTLSQIEASLSKFEGAGRRFQVYSSLEFNTSRFTLVDDYGHHPREIAATLKAARQAWPSRKIVLAFQPHRYSRTKALFQEFIDVLSEVDQLLLLDIYSAGEIEDPEFNGQRLYTEISKRVTNQPIFIQRNQALVDILPNIIKNNDVLLVQGAGDIGAQVNKIVQQFQLMDAKHDERVS